MRSLCLSVIAALLLVACNPNVRHPAKVELQHCPSFNVDSAFVFVEQQLKHGPRIPLTDGHRLTGDFLVQKLNLYGFSVSEQIDTIIVYDQIQKPLRNIIATFGPQDAERILLCAHWDSRPVADHDTSKQTSPIDGANDNASGVAILLELARLVSITPPSVGIELVFFDLEDQGRPAYEPVTDPYDHGFCMGSKYWAENLGPNQLRYGILLDMVGAKDAIFSLEGISYQYAREEMEHLWNLGNQLGYGKHFQYNRTKGIIDDHNHVNEIAKVPCLNIIQHDAQTPSNFGSYWHTHADEISILDRETITAVGQTVLQVVYNEPVK